MTNRLAVIILTYNEEIHLQRCLESIRHISDQILIIDSYSTDRTIEIATQLNARVFQNRFVSQAQQFQWAIDNCLDNPQWILRLDADEHIDPDLALNIVKFIAEASAEVNGAIFMRKHIFLGRWIKHGGRYPVYMLRLFRRGTAHIEQKWMDEHIVLDAGKSVVLRGGFSDENINSISWFIEKHNKYASREMIDIMLKRLYPQTHSPIPAGTGFSIRINRLMKELVYLRLPYFVRPFLYFCFRYFLQLGFLDGKQGLAYHFMQGFWYRMLVDLKCMEMEGLWKDCTNDDEKLRMLEVHTGYRLRQGT